MRKMLGTNTRISGHSPKSQTSVIENKLILVDFVDYPGHSLRENG